MKINKIYIIHYTKLTERKEHILSVLENVNIPYEFIEVYDKENLIGNTYYNPNEELCENKIRPLWNIREHGFRILNDNEISCTIKHIIAIKKISEECEECGLIIEDDAIPYHNNFITQIEDLILMAPKNWGSIFFGEGCGNDFIGLKEKEHISGKLFKVKHPASNCAEAYVLHKNSAKIVSESMSSFQLVSDWEMASAFYTNNLDVYWNVPPLFYQGSKSGKFKSTLR